MTWRLFIAVPVPEAIKRELKRVQDELGQGLPVGCIRWTRPDQIHLTLRFLGSVESTFVERLKPALQRASTRFRPLQLHAASIGFFPGPRHPRVIWAGVGDPENQLGELQRTVEQAVQEFTSERAEKEFAGHITLGRCHGMDRRHAQTLSTFAHGMVDREFGRWTADHVELIRSELGSGGSRYTTLFASALQQCSS